MGIVLFSIASLVERFVLRWRHAAAASR
jgi:hypothetical protein